MDELISNLITLLSNQFTTTFKSYEYGKVEIPATSDLPMITVNPVSTVVSNSGTVRDVNDFSVEVVVYANAKKYLDNISTSSTTRTALQQLVRWMEDRDTDGVTTASSIVSVIRRNITASGAVLFNNQINIDYSDYITNEEFPVVKAKATFTAQSRSDRN